MFLHQKQPLDSNRFWNTNYKSHSLDSYSNRELSIHLSEVIRSYDTILTQTSNEKNSGNDEDRGDDVFYYVPGKGNDWSKAISIYDLPDKKHFLNTFYPSVLSIMFVKNLLVILNPNLQKLQNKLDNLTPEEEEEIEISEYLMPNKYANKDNIWHGVLDALKFAMFRDAVTLQINRVIEHLTLPWFTFRTAKALVKDMTSSAVRKYSRYGVSLSFGAKLFKSALRSHLLFFASVFCFNVSFAFYEKTQHLHSTMTLQKAQEGVKKFVSDTRLQVEVGEIIGFHLMQCGKSWVFTGVGAVLGSYALPGIGTLLGINIFPLVGNILMDEITKHPQKKNS